MYRTTARRLSVGTFQRFSSSKSDSWILSFFFFTFTSRSNSYLNGVCSKRETHSVVSRVASARESVETGPAVWAETCSRKKENTLVEIVTVLERPRLLRLLLLAFRRRLSISRFKPLSSSLLRPRGRASRQFLKSIRFRSFRVVFVLLRAELPGITACASAYFRVSAQQKKKKK